MKELKIMFIISGTQGNAKRIPASGKETRPEIHNAGLEFLGSRKTFEARQDRLKMRWRRWSTQ